MYISSFLHYLPSIYSFFLQKSDSFQEMCRVIFRQVFFRFFDVLGMFSRRRMFDIKCVFSVHDSWTVRASQYLRWLIARRVANNNAFIASKTSFRGAKLVSRDSSNFLRGANNRSNATIKNLLRETQNSLRGTNNSSNATEKLLRGAKYFLCGANNRNNATQNLQETKNSLRGRNSQQWGTKSPS